MPFRRYRKTYRRSRRLTKANIYGNRSAKSQSKQIAALNRKVNIIAKNNRPEIRTMFKNFENTFTNSALSTNFYYTSLSPWSGSYTGDDVAASSKVIQGNYCKCRGVSVKVITQYADNWRETIADASHDASAGYRIVVLQRKIASPISEEGGGYSLNYNDVFETTNTLTSADTNLTLPLVQGLTSTYKVLFSKVYTISRYHPTRQHNIYIPGSKCLNFSKDVSLTTSSANSKGFVLVAILTGGLHHDIDYDAQIKVAGTTKIAFTDN